MHLQKYQSFQWSWSWVVIPGMGLLALGIKAAGISQILDIAAKGLFYGGCALIIIGLVYTLPMANKLEIDEDGFTYRNGWQRLHCRWEDCGEFSPAQRKLLGLIPHEIVTFDYIDPALPADIAIKPTGQSAALPGTFGLQAGELAQKMNGFRAMHDQRQQKPVKTFL